MGTNTKGNVLFMSAKKPAKCPPNAASRYSPLLSSGLLAQRFLYLFDCRMAVLLLLGEDQLPVDGNFEHPAARRYELELLDVLAELIQERLRQAHGLGKVVSHIAVFDRDR